MGNDDLISASEIAEFVYCQRAWWYRQHGYASTQQAVMAAGTEQHETLNKQVQTTIRLRRWAWRLVLLGAVLLALLLVLRLLSGAA